MLLLRRFSLVSLLVIPSWSLILNNQIRLNSHRHEHVLHNSKDSYNAVMIIPTGIGASIGGFAGDALPVAKLLSTVVDTLITHPNVINGASMYWPMKNVLYVEGYALDEFANQRLGLKPITKSSQSIGLLMDCAIEKDLQLRHLQVASAAKATLGINVAHCVITSSPVEVEVASLSLGGASWGGIGNVDTLLEAAGKLYELGCTAIAVVVRFPEDEEGDDEVSVREQVESFQQYRLGVGVDRIAGAEAIISHVITKKLMIPCAHAPAFLPSDVAENVSPKACAEEIGYTYLPCVLSYLHRAPNLIPYDKIDNRVDVITASDVDAVVVPADALGGSAVLAFIAQGKLIIAVEDNKTCMRSFAESLQISKLNNIVTVRSYAEAAGILAAHKAGILLESITTEVTSVPITYL